MVRRGKLSATKVWKETIENIKKLNHIYELISSSNLIIEFRKALLGLNDPAKFQGEDKLDF